MKKYIPQTFEDALIAIWDQEGVYTPKDDSKKEKMYTLSMFPYPSGAGLHVGHTRIYTGTDVISRYFRMKGYNLLYPMGWDAFGLPAENAAIKAKKNPMDMVPQNIENFKYQMNKLGLAYNWSREFSTTDPEYYGMTQWLFTEFYKLGLLYKKNTPVYFCPTCKTGLAEEEVLPNGTHERCGNLITRKELPQWIFRITTYADSLLDGLKGLDWPNGILEMQKKWIGKKEGINIHYSIKNVEETVTCFTTRPDTNFGATFVVIAPEHHFVKRILSGEIAVDEKTKQEIEAYVATSLAKTDVERIAEGRKKTGAFTGFYAINNLTGREMPVWVSDFVLSGFGTGAVVGVPAHDLRDFEFAQQFGIEIIRVVSGKDGDVSPISKPEQVQEDAGTMVNSGFLNGLDIHDATQKIMDYLEEKGWGERVVSYHLRDWIFSRQRYWGEPIPMVYCESCALKNQSWFTTEQGNAFTKTHQTISKVDKELQNNMAGWFIIDQKTLPLELPYMESYEPTGTGESPLAQATEWVSVPCPQCGGAARRETDTMPNWAGSCWYFLAFAFWDKTKKQPVFDQEQIKKWLPVDWYVGGAEHAVLHLLYARFWMHVLNDLKFIDFREPFLRLRNVGMVLAEDHRKMSKSWGNVINPTDVVSEYGADALRVYEMFMAPFNQEISWSTSALQGAFRFLQRLWYLFHSETSMTDNEAEVNRKLRSKLYKTIEKVGNDIVEIKYNTAIAAMMEFLNDWEKNGPKLTREDAKKMLQILAPFAPFMTDEIWRNVFGEKESIHISTWPTFDRSQIETEELVIPVQVNGKTRSSVIIPIADANKDSVVKKALEEEKLAKYVQGREYDVIYVEKRILNFVVKG
ncbi:leucine--tRNA ligase [Candidatus Roizmanbacteria bacterium]|nr:leucine--tRNA ligase [Candidatus Roizmanbacteria bacterium]